MERQLEMLTPREGLRRIPELTEPMRLALTAIELCGGLPLAVRRLSRVGSSEPYEVDARVLKRLIRERLIEVVSLAPAVYRVTKLGRIAHSLVRR
jgi:hypothetical protein